MFKKVPVIRLRSLFSKNVSIEPAVLRALFIAYPCDLSRLANTVGFFFLSHFGKIKAAENENVGAPGIANITWRTMTKRSAARNRYIAQPNHECRLFD